MELTTHQQLFHQTLGCYIAAKTYRDYTGGLVSILEKELSKNTNKKPKKGVKTFIQLTKENELKAAKHIKDIEGLMKSLFNLDGEVEGLVASVEVMLHEFLTLSESGQRRINSLLAKIQREESEVNHLKELENA